MNLAWERAEAQAAIAGGEGNWKEAERHLSKAVKMSRDMAPLTRLGTMCDYAVALKMLGKADAYAKLRSDISKLALETSGLELAKFCEILCNPDEPMPF